MKKVLALVLVLLCLSCEALAAQNEYNFKEQQGVTNVDINVLGYYLWSVPAETTLHFTTSEPSTDNVFGEVKIYNVVFDQTDFNWDSILSDDTHGLGAEKLIYVGITNRSDLVYNAPLYVDGSGNYSTEAGTGKTAVTDYSVLSTDLKAKYTSTVKSEEWGIYQEMYKATPDADDNFAYSEKFVIPDSDTVLKMPTLNQPLGDSEVNLPVLSVRTMADGTLTKVESVIFKVESDLYNGWYRQAPNEFDNSSNVSAKNPNFLVYTNGIDAIDGASTTLYYTCFGTPTLLGTHTGEVTYVSHVIPMFITVDP